jgi:DNA-binding transcriptional LysR family regulator
MNYTLNQLRIFRKIVKLESITKAAQELHLSQPAVSIQLKNLQEQFEVPLTEVIGRKLHITDFGYEIAESADKIIGEAYNMRHKSMAHKGHLTGRIKVTVVSTAKYVMPFFISEFLAENPGVDLKMDVTNKSRVIESLEQNEVDFAMVSVLPEKLRIDRIELLQNKLFLVGKQPLADEGKSISSKDLEKLTLIFREKGSATRAAMQEFIDKNQLSVNKEIELTSNEAVKQAVIAGFGYSIMPLIGIKNELLNGDLYIIPISQLPITTEWNLIWLQDKKFSPATKAYIEYLQANKERLIAERFSWFENYK